MSNQDPTTPVTPTVPHTPSFTSIPTPLDRTASQKTNNNTHRRNSSIISIPLSPMVTTLPASQWQRRESSQEDMVMSSPILDQVPTDASTNIKEKLQSAPPQYHISVEGPEQVNQGYKNALEQLRSPLIPLISVTNGQSHASFPTNLLQYHLLTHPELDDLSVYYHQTEPPTEHSCRYPCRVPGWLPPPSTRPMEQRRPIVTLDTKRRRFGRFIGLRGCESPQDDQKDMEERMEREWQRQLERRADEERMKDKTWRGAW